MKRRKSAKFAFGKMGTKAYISIMESHKRINIWEGAVRSGKTICSIIRWIQECKDGPPGEFVMVGKTERTLKRNILDVIESMVPAEHYHLNLGLGELTLYGRTIYLVGANDARAEGKIRGGTFAGAYVDEVTILPEEFFKMLLSRLSVKGAKLFGTTNPDSPYHWLKVNFLENPNISLATWHFELEDNPNLDPDYVSNLKAEYTGLWYKRFIQGLWVMAEGAIYDMWDDVKHIVKAPAFLQHKIAAIDYGTTNPCTFGLYGWDDVDRYAITPQKRVIHLIREYYFDSKKAGRQKTDGEYADDFIAFCGNDIPEIVYVDPSATSFIVELQKRGIKVEPANNDVVDGIRFVSMLLNRGEFVTDPSCIDTIRERTAYVWDSKAQQRGIDQPLKQYDHTQDRDRYALYTHFGQDYAWNGNPDWL